MFAEIEGYFKKTDSSTKNIISFVIKLIIEVFDSKLH